MSEVIKWISLWHAFTVDFKIYRNHGMVFDGSLITRPDFKGNSVSFELFLLKSGLAQAN